MIDKVESGKLEWKREFTEDIKAGVYIRQGNTSAPESADAIREMIREIGIFTERQRFTGSILKQLDEAYATMNRYNRTRSEISGLHRIDNRDYPEGILREALINAIVHRDYDRDVSTNIRIFDDRIEIASYGGLPPNTTIETFLLGLSMTRNRNLADLFYRLELIEAFGSGIPKMTDFYHEHGLEIRFKTSPSGFMITLPNLNYPKEFHANAAEWTSGHLVPEDVKSQRSRTATDWIKQHGPARRKDLEQAWGISRNSASIWIDQLVAEGIIQRWGNGRNTRYILGKQE